VEVKPPADRLYFLSLASFILLFLNVMPRL
jgi:hypothetical protein